MPYRLLPLGFGFSTLIGVFSAHASVGITVVATAAHDLPEWSKFLLGPLGGLVGTLVAVWWLAKRLTRVEEQARQQRQADSSMLMEILRTQVEVATKCHAAIEANTRALERFEDRN